MWKKYKKKNIPYSLRRGISFFIPNANTQKYGINSLNFRGSVLWNNLQIKLKEYKSLQEFKLLLKQSGNLPYTYLSVMLFLNFNIYVLVCSVYVCKYF